MRLGPEILALIITICLFAVGAAYLWGYADAVADNVCLVKPSE